MLILIQIRCGCQANFQLFTWEPGFLSVRLYCLYVLESLISIAIQQREKRVWKLLEGRLRMGGYVFCPRFTGQNSVSWCLVPTEEAGKYGLQLCGQ